MNSLWDHLNTQGCDDAGAALRPLDEHPHDDPGLAALDCRHHFAFRLLGRRLRHAVYPAGATCSTR